MAKGYFLTNEIKMLIAKIHDEHPDWGPTKTREELVRVLRETGLYKNFDKNWPSVSAVGAVLRPIKKKESELGPDSQDKPWSISTLDKCPIPPEALPKVLEEYRQHKAEGTDLTTREAKWIARLSALPATQCPRNLPYHIARTELLYELLDEAPNFDIFDKLLADLPGNSDDWQVPFWASASLAGILKNDPVREYKSKKGGIK